MTKNKLKPLYTHYYDTAKYKIKSQEQLRKDKFVWKVGIFIITLISVLGIFAISWAATL